MKALIIDDERIARQELRRLLAAHRERAFEVSGSIWPCSFEATVGAFSSKVEFLAQQRGACDAESK